MIGMIAVALAIAVLLIIALIRPRDTILDGVVAAYIFVAIAYLPMLFLGGLHLLFAFGEGGEGWFHLVFALPIFLAMYLIYRQPTWGSVLLTLAGIALYVENAVTPSQGNPDAINPAVPFLIPGIFMMIAVAIAQLFKRTLLGPKHS